MFYIFTLPQPDHINDVDDDPFSYGRYTHEISGMGWVNGLPGGDEVA